MNETMEDWNKRAWAELTVAERNAAFLRECERRAGATREEMLRYTCVPESKCWAAELLRRVLTGAE